MRHRDLLAAIADLEPVQIERVFERHCSLRWEELKASAAGGRWGAPRAFEVLYLGRPRDSVIVEAYRHLVDDELDDAEELAAAVLERRIITCAIDVPNLLDLRPVTARGSVGLTERDLSSDVDDYAACQRAGAAAHQLGLSGIVAPSATRLGETLALYTTNLPVENWPIVTARDIWHGLPADPCRLRAVDEDASGSQACALGEGARSASTDFRCRGEFLRGSVAVSRHEDSPLGVSGLIKLPQQRSSAQWTDPHEPATSRVMGGRRRTVLSARLGARRPEWLIAPGGTKNLDTDLSHSDRAWWPEVKKLWRSTAMRKGLKNQRVHGKQKGGRIAYASVVRASCGSSLVARSLTVGVGPRHGTCNACVSSMFFVDRFGRPFIYWSN